MRKKETCILAVGLMAAMLTACSNNHAESAMPNNYTINATSVENSTNQYSTESEYEISDLLPPLSDDTLIISVEEAEAIMNRNKGTKSDADTEAEETEETEELFP